jgi:hypothetical protein
MSPLVPSVTPFDQYASPDRRTLEYVLGRRPEWAYRHFQYREVPDSTGRVVTKTIDAQQPVSNDPVGGHYSDTGVYNFSAYFEPFGRSINRATNDLGPYGAFQGVARLFDKLRLEPLIYYNAGCTQPNRYNFEAARYPLWVMTTGMSLRYYAENPTGSSVPYLWNNTWNRCAWWPTGRYGQVPGTNPSNTSESWSGFGWTYTGICRDNLFHGFGFDLFNPGRCSQYVRQNSYWGANNVDTYAGSGIYGFPNARSFQLHFVPQVAKGRFWTDLLANWYFGGAPGYTSQLGTSGQYSNNWAHLGSSYDSLGLGTNWMPPTMHVWMPGFWNNGLLSAAWETPRGLVGDPGNMPPCKPAATYVHPMRKWSEDWGPAHAQLLYGNTRLTLRATGIQENWGFDGADNGAGRWYDAVNVNVSNFQVVYGLLTPEKIPSMMNRTAVAPHLHWKARLLDGMYRDCDKFQRYDPNAKAPVPYDPTRIGDADLGRVPAPVAVMPVPPPVPPPPLLDLAGEFAFGYIKDASRTDYLKPYFVAKANFKPFTLWNTGTQKFDPLLAIGETDFVSQSTNELAVGKELTTTNKQFIAPADWRYSIHKAYCMDPGRPDGHASKSPSDAPAVAGYADGDKFNEEDFYYRVYGKMDFTTKEPLDYKDETGAVVRKGSDRPADDVFIDTHYNLGLSPNCRYTPPNALSQLPDSTMMPRPNKEFDNWADWFAQRSVAISTEKNEVKIDAVALDEIRRPEVKFKPQTNIDGSGFGLTGNFPEGRHRLAAGDGIKLDGNKLRVPYPRLHPTHGSPNPDYLQLYPGSIPSWHWADQYRRYFPIVGKYQENPASPPGPDLQYAGGAYPGAPSWNTKLVDSELSKRAAAEPDPIVPTPDTADLTPELLNPMIPVTKGRQYVNTPFVPAINKDEAWRVTRLGQKYQDIIANEIMDYQMNPYWPNPQEMWYEICVPLDVKPMDESSRSGAVGQVTDAGAPRSLKNWTKTAGWQSIREARVAKPGDPEPRIGDACLRMQIPHYYAYFNRFWTRSITLYDRAWPNPPPQDNPPFCRGNPFAEKEDAAATPPKVFNPIENRGMYPQAFQYYGVCRATVELKDRIKDFPENTLEDQLGSEWRYTSNLARLMRSDSYMRTMPARNHPFKNWADFVAMLGHLVYRSPLKVTDFVAGRPGGDPQELVQNGYRDELMGVHAWEVCHGASADSRNKPNFFDGSTVGSQTEATADALQGSYWFNSLTGQIGAGAGARPVQKSIVALDGFWPIAANYGVWPGPYPYDPAGKKPEDMMYPDLPQNAPADWGLRKNHEWRRRVDEWRGRDASGLRVEHNYISEAAANDVLVSLSNGRIGPIDFDGDGHVTMTRRERDASKQYLNQVALPDGPLYTTFKDYWPGFPWNTGNGNTEVVEYNDLNVGGYSDRNSLDYGVAKANNWKKAAKNEVIIDCVTLPIKFRSNTFRITVAADVTDNRFSRVYSSTRMSRVYSRVPGVPAGNIQVHGAYTGEFILHSARTIGGVDPELSWLGVE